MDANDDFKGKATHFKLFLQAYNFWTKTPQTGYFELDTP